MDMTTIDLQQMVQREIAKFARLAGLPYDHPDPLGEFHVAATQWLPGNAYAMARLSVLAYLDPSTIEEHLREAHVLHFAWFEETNTDTQGFGCMYGNDLILSFRGTESKRDAILDARRNKTDFLVGERVVGRVHEGFAEAANAIAPEVETFLNKHYSDNRIWLTCHSRCRWLQNRDQYHDRVEAHLQ
jgi:hypothetical protein